MAEHIRHHPMMARFLPCAYCSDWFHSEAMISHVDKEHGLSKFQCRYCFFRAFDAYCVFVHQSYYHPDAVKGDIFDVLTDEADSRRMKWKNDVSTKIVTTLKPLECKECNHKMLTFSTYQEHIKHIVGPMIRCQFCSQFISKDNIFGHLLTHGIGSFECLYCNHAVKDYEHMELHLCNNHSSKPMYCVSRLTTSENFEKKKNMLKSMASSVFVRKMHIKQEEKDETKRSNQCPIDEKLLDTQEASREKVKRKHMSSLQAVPSEESIQSLSTPASVETAPSRRTSKKGPMLPVIVKVQGGVKLSDSGEIIADSESITTQWQENHMVTTNNSTCPVEANQQLPLVLIPPKVVKNNEEVTVDSSPSEVQRASDDITIGMPTTDAELKIRKVVGSNQGLDRLVKTLMMLAVHHLLLQNLSK
uniref:Uncharacterized protein n=1 Tax=Anopheles albimanus TaxID=7167 RepID=A0A182FTF8_ANOAL